MKPYNKTIQQPSTAVHVQYECTVRNRATVQGELANVCISEFRRLHIAIDSIDYWLLLNIFTKLPNNQTIRKFHC